MRITLATQASLLASKLKKPSQSEHCALGRLITRQRAPRARDGAQANQLRRV